MSASAWTSLTDRPVSCEMVRREEGLRIRWVSIPAWRRSSGAGRPQIAPEAPVVAPLTAPGRRIHRSLITDPLSLQEPVPSPAYGAPLARFTAGGPITDHFAPSPFL